MSSVSSERNPNARTKKTNPLKQLDWIGRSQNPDDDDPPAPQRNQFHHKDIWVWVHCLNVGLLRQTQGKNFALIKKTFGEF